MTKWSSDRTSVASPPSSEVLEEMALALAQSTIHRAMKASKIKRSKLAERMERPRSFITRMLKGDHNLTIKTLARALAGCGYEIRFNYVPIESTSITTVPCTTVAPSPANASHESNSNFAMVA